MRMWWLSRCMVRADDQRIRNARRLRPVLDCWAGPRCAASDVARPRCRRAADICRPQGLTGRNRDRPGLAQALAAVREGDTLVVPKPDWLARSVPDARAIADELERSGVRLQIGATVYDPTDPMGRMFSTCLPHSLSLRLTCCRLAPAGGMLVAKAEALKGKPPKLSAAQHAHLIKLLEAGEYSVAELAELFGVSRATVYRSIEREERRRLGVSAG